MAAPSTAAKSDEPVEVTLTPEAVARAGIKTAKEFFMRTTSEHPAPRLTIGRLSEKTGCHLESVRYYERIGWLRPPGRTAGGHRIYGSEAVSRLTSSVGLVSSASHWSRSAHCFALSMAGTTRARESAR
jgi:hypothetical protein